MKLTVMKFGGTSLATPEKIQRAAERAVATRRSGFGVVVVVSAPGEMTDELITLAGKISTTPDARELDQLIATGEQVSIALFAMACRERGAQAISLTGAQAGIEVAGQPGAGAIRRIKTSVIARHVRAGRIVVVAGFQGRAANGDTLTLGRGGSDLTAVALAAALKTGRCEIFSDIKGVYTADPRIVHNARRLPEISFGEMLTLAAAGAQVMQARSMALAKRHNVRLHIRSAFHAQAGTWVVAVKRPSTGKVGVTSLALAKHEKSKIAEISAVGAGLSAGDGVTQRMKDALIEQGIEILTFKPAASRATISVESKHAEIALRAIHQALGLARKER